MTNRARAFGQRTTRAGLLLLLALTGAACGGSSGKNDSPGTGGGGSQTRPPATSTPTLVSTAVPTPTRTSTAIPTPTATATATPTSPASTPTIPALHCPERRGSGFRGVGFPDQILRWQLDHSRADEDVDGTLTWGAEFRNTAASSQSYTGSLRISLVALPSSFSGNPALINVFRIFTLSPEFTGPGARSASQIYNHSAFRSIVSRASGGTPPPGAYCIVMFLEEYSEECTTPDKYCWVDWAQTSGAAVFR